MNALDRKLIRDLLAIKSQALAIGLVISAGVAMLVMALCALHSLTNSKDTYYERYRFADLFTYVKRAPRSQLAKLESIPGVAQVQARISPSVPAPGPDVPRSMHAPSGRRRRIEWS